MKISVTTTKNLTNTKFKSALGIAGQLLSWASMNRPPWRRGFVLTALILTVFALSPTVQAVTPAPDGGYAGNNTAEGTQALFSLTSGTNNTANGFQALYHNTSGVGNTAVGYSALFHNTGGFFGVGSDNTAVGNIALFDNTTGGANTAVGSGALYFNTTGHLNTATGVSALGSNRGGGRNTAMGYSALGSYTTGYDNTAVGAYAGYAGPLGGTGSNNTSIGSGAGEGSEGGSISGSNNTALGVSALVKNSTGNTNTGLGFGGGENITGNNNIDIGNLGVGGDSNTIRIGEQTATTEPGQHIPLPAHTRTFIAGIHGASEGGSGISAVYINSAGQLGTQAPPSSQRYKSEIKPMDKASEAILKLQPVTFCYKHELDPDSIPQFGLVAEEVEKVSPDLVARDEEGKSYTVRYEAVNAMLLNEFLKEHRQVQAEQKEIDALRSELREQRALIRKVTARVELQTAPAQTVANSKGPSQLPPTLR